MTGSDFLKGGYFFFTLFFLDGATAVKGATSLGAGGFGDISPYRCFLFDPS